MLIFVSRGLSKIQLIMCRWVDPLSSAIIVPGSALVMMKAILRAFRHSNAWMGQGKPQNVH